MYLLVSFLTCFVLTIHLMYEQDRVDKILILICTHYKIITFPFHNTGKCQYHEDMHYNDISLHSSAWRWIRTCYFSQYHAAYCSSYSPVRFQSMLLGHLRIPLFPTVSMNAGIVPSIGHDCFLPNSCLSNIRDHISVSFDVI
jgi:hypothetical protein